MLDWSACPPSRTRQVVPLDPERWRLLSPLLDRLLDLSAPARISLLDQLHAYSPELAEELSSLLASDADAGARAFLESPPEKPADGSGAEPGR
jgi:hypothetical protein